ncbi:MAG TPA: hypothetical protein DHV65_20635, partial [Ktedonobacter sp.]|nr:hypothetical protein [Ktedonobacter sp.]
MLLRALQNVIRTCVIEWASRGVGVGVGMGVGEGDGVGVDEGVSAGAEALLLVLVGEAFCRGSRGS